MKILKYLVIVGLVALGGWQSLFGQVQHFESGVIIVKPGALRSSEQRLTDVLEKYTQYLPIARLALFNIAYPKDEQENLELQGYCILEVIVCTQTEQELPISAIRFTNGQNSISIPYSWSLRNDNTNPEIIRGLGKFRGQYYFMVPYGLLHLNGQFSFDFKINRSNYSLVKLPIADQCNYIPLPIPQTVSPELEAKIQAFMVREFELDYANPQ